MTLHFVHRFGRAGSVLPLALFLAATGCAGAGGPRPSPAATPAAAQEPATDRRAQAHYKLGVEYLRQGETALAIRELRGATQYDPSDVWARLALAEAYRLKGHLDLAGTELGEALRLRPDFQQARLNLSALYIQMERYEDAVAQARMLLEDPTFPVPWKALTNQGYAEYKLGRLREARQSLELAVEYHADYWQALLNLGILEADEGRRLEALERFDRVLALQPGPLAESEVNYRIGEIYVALGNRERALEHLTAAASNRPSGPWGKRSEDYLKRLR
jgi:type IV pilus biogenesis/stability protein PilW